MLKSAHADVLDEPHSQIKDLKLYSPDKLDNIKSTHRAIWQIFKNFNLAIYADLLQTFTKPHIESWRNGWETRCH